MTSTDSAVERWIEHYGKVNRKNMVEFLGIGDEDWNTDNDTRRAIKANFETSAREG